jgi:hypothetical protein
MALQHDPEVFEPRAPQRTTLRPEEIRIPAADGRTLVIRGIAHFGLGHAVSVMVEPPGRAEGQAVSLTHAYSADEPVEAMLLRLIHQCQALRQHLRAGG